MDDRTVSFVLTSAWLMPDAEAQGAYAARAVEFLDMIDATNVHVAASAPHELEVRFSAPERVPAAKVIAGVMAAVPTGALAGMIRPASRVSQS